MTERRASPLLPMTRDEMDARGWRELDVLLVTGDAYFDHPSHGAAVIGRVLEAAGYKVGIVARPDARSTADFARLGRPALFAGVTAGAVDSIVNNWTADMRRRRDDAYAPGGRGGDRPDNATIVYANRVREAFPGLPVVLGGIEASLRRFVYFDPRKAAVRRSVLVDSRADLLVYGAGEAPVLKIAARLSAGRDLAGIPGTARLTRDPPVPVPGVDVELPGYEDVAADLRLLVSATEALEATSRPFFAGRVRQRHAEGWVVAEPRPDVDLDELDRIFALPFSRTSHPSYREPVPALETVRWSVISHRGCPGGCSFCGLAVHQGRVVSFRSAASILDEIHALARFAGFKGTISDVGGPTANAFSAVTSARERCRACRRSSCLHPAICRHLSADHGPLLAVLDDASRLSGVRRVLLASGIRHDLALRDPRFVEAIAARHTGGHLKVAPEHVASDVLRRMRKPEIGLFEEFERRFLEASRRAGKQQYLVPYFIYGFPGCAAADADLTGAWLARRGQRLRQVQGFIPLPGTLAAALYAARVDEDGSPLFVADPRERARQKAMLVMRPAQTVRNGPRRY
ncbi:MAG: YgiQ family radical SAM protein [Deltaproteobacteria bacterium]|nr:YgiQ family radical SAM protein [Deltaproteobacteria bacterium]